MARSKIRKSNSALSRGQMVRIEQFPIITFVVDPLGVTGACCPSAATFPECADCQVRTRLECCQVEGTFFEGITCGQITCCEAPKGRCCCPCDFEEGNIGKFTGYVTEANCATAEGCIWKEGDTSTNCGQCPDTTAFCCEEDCSNNCGSGTRRTSIQAGSLAEAQAKCGGTIVGQFGCDEDTCPETCLQCYCRCPEAPPDGSCDPDNTNKICETVEVCQDGTVPGATPTGDPTGGIFCGTDELDCSDQGTDGECGNEGTGCGFCCSVDQNGNQIIVPSSAGECDTIGGVFSETGGACNVICCEQCIGIECTATCTDQCSDNGNGTGIVAIDCQRIETQICTPFWGGIPPNFCDTVEDAATCICPSLLDITDGYMDTINDCYCQPPCCLFDTGSDLCDNDIAPGSENCDNQRCYIDVILGGDCGGNFNICTVGPTIP